MLIRQGDIFWLQLVTDDGAEPRIPHPHVIIQGNSGSNTVRLCALTSNLNRVAMPGNVLLDPGEANLSRRSVVEVSKVVTVERAQLGDYIGTLSDQRVTQILAGIAFVERSFLGR